MEFILNPSAYRVLLRPLIFRLAPETAQKLAEKTFKIKPIWKLASRAMAYSHPALKTQIAGITIESPIGLAAGYDKNFEFLPTLSSLGFGYVTGGTVTQKPQMGNPRPRVVRYTQDESLVNAYGFPSKGIVYAARQLSSLQENSTKPVIASISGLTIDEIVKCQRKLEHFVSAVEVNISSPNTAGLKMFHDPIVLCELLKALNTHRTKPLFIKMPPFPSRFDTSAATKFRSLVLNLAELCAEHHVDALTIANTQPIEDARLAVGRGGLSGKLVFPAMLRMVEEVRKVVGDKITINAAGGISSGADAFQALSAGADSLQVLTSLIYDGPGIVKSINKELSDILELNSITSVSKVKNER